MHWFSTRHWFGHGFDPCFLSILGQTTVEIGGKQRTDASELSVGCSAVGITLEMRWNWG